MGIGKGHKKSLVKVNIIVSYIIREQICNMLRMNELNIFSETSLSRGVCVNS